MGYKLREIEAESKFSQELSLPAIEHLVPKATIAAVLTAEGRVTQRERKLNLLITVLLVIMINIYTSDSITDVLEKMAQGLRYIWPDPDYGMPNASAISHRRYQVGARPVATLFHQVCQPLASRDTPGAFLFGLRLMAIDGTTVATTFWTWARKSASVRVGPEKGAISWPVTTSRLKMKLQVPCRTYSNSMRSTLPGSIGKAGHLRSKACTPVSSSVLIIRSPCWASVGAARYSSHMSATLTSKSGSSEGVSQ